MLITKKRGKYKRKIGSTKGPCPSLVERIWASFTCCEYCGISTFEAFIGFDERGHQYWHRTFGVDRIRPGAVGGLYEPDNVTLACSSCNSRKGKRDFIGPVRSLTTMEALLNKKYGDHRWGWPTMASYRIWYPWETRHEEQRYFFQSKRECEL